MATQQPDARERGWSATAVALTIFLGGMAVVTVLVVWALTQSNGVASAVAAPVVPAAAHEMAGMKGMAGMEATSPAAASTAGAAAESEAAATGGSATPPAHEAYDAVLPPVGAGNVHHYTIRLADEVLDIAPGVRYSAGRSMESPPVR